MFIEEKTSWDREMLIREAVECAEQGFTVHLKNGARIAVAYDSPSIDLIIYGLEKTIRGNHERARMTFIDFMYYWHERIFKQIKRKPRSNK
ncbi:hypothetical protein [Raoultella planticola]|uniref:Uncharacterized protein n=1 Tax=Raoultella planticola TaxID=575 RepID=A0A443VMG5_RAOPL|nr:hypothetical protein [Raoultella planticola]MDY7623041.1 hypothetical protein [Raoultella planticola]OAZ79197.1 hypothetical protein AYO05_24920 [Raoultella planticola]OAZ87788.1 hypothetical protein AYO04_00800 [Raoultella planticola]RWT22468.1 hypothetical protein DN603_13900 [Raoultella planticola]UAN08886.1 hypothetical protein KGP19_16570 [Raoultella planticola]